MLKCASWDSFYKRTDQTNIGKAIPAPLLLPLNNFQTHQRFIVQLHSPQKKTKWINNKHVSLKYFVPVLNIFRERWAWRSDWKRLSDSGWGRSLGLWWFSRMGTSSKFVHFLPLLLLLPFLLVGGESQNKNRGQIFLDCLHGKICRNCAKLFVALNCFKWYLKSQGTFENKTNLFHSKLCSYSET